MTPVQRFVRASSLMLFAMLMAPAVHAQFSDPAYICPFSASGGDLTSRGFYAENYPGTTLGGVILRMQAVGADGPHDITLIAREGTYDGPLIGSASVNIALNTTTLTDVSFDFANAAVTGGATVTFEIDVTSDPTDFGGATYNVGQSACAGITQTNGTTPPLDSFRRDQVGVEIYTMSSSAPADTTPPVVSSVVRALPSPTDAQEVIFQVTFSENVNSLDVSDLALTTTGDIAGAFVISTSAPGGPADTSVWNVSVDTGTGSGTIRLDVVDDDSIEDEAGNPLGGIGAGNGDFSSGEVYEIDRGTVAPPVGGGSPAVPIPTLGVMGLAALSVLTLLLGFGALRPRN